jgi:fructokinase
LGVQLILVSDGKNPVQLITPQQTHSIATPSINAVDTTGAGDSLISGFLFALAQQQLEQPQLNANLERLIDAAEFAVKCGAYTCTKLGAMPALPTYDEVN